MTIIFLDIDGVLNNLRQGHIDINCVKVLQKVYRKLDAKIVLSSSWRLGYSKFGKCSPQVQNLVNILNSMDMEIIGRTGKFSNRFEEVQEYIKSHDVRKYVVLDDDISEFGKMFKGLYLVNYKTGLVEKDVNKILKAVVDK